MQIYKEFTFDSAHSLPNVPEGHKCGRLHGHTFKVKLVLCGVVGDKSGWVEDFGCIKQQFKPILNILDHYYLNDIAGLENPTSENISIWIWNKTKPMMPLLSAVEVMETCTSGVIFCAVCYQVNGQTTFPL